MDANSQNSLIKSSVPRALITGASSGLGVEFARALAQRGHSLIVTARRRERLETLAAELEKKYAVAVTVVPADLSVPGGPQQLFDAVQAAGLRVDILVNNAGFGYFGPFLGQSLEQIGEMLWVNVSALTTLTRLFAQAMKEQGGGHILQVSSYAALQPIPRYCVYSAAKAYVVALAQTLRYELRKSNVRVSVVAPGFMPTEFHDVARHEKSKLMKMMTYPAAFMAERAISGMFKNKLLITPGLMYHMNNWALRLLPRSAASALSAAVVRS